MTFQTFAFARVRSRGASPSRDNSVALILLVMMTLVFAPVIGMHLVAAFSPSSLPTNLLSRSTDAAIPPG
ncbi:hypothetical protein [Methylobacterium marchantiae]|uniref:Uncharacterized protein n=1 Tax=Methylobacterium marchantiae TaxID=600331 RepID=A0ABW3X1F4_9HYPH|nr:hypothetical protein AIGOOFII_1013 [Methylobacterium marchantiae]